MLDLPPYAVNVFIPIEDISSELGPTEFLPSSHKSSNAETIDEYSSGWCITNEWRAAVPKPTLESKIGSSWRRRSGWRGTKLSHRR